MRVIDGWGWEREKKEGGRWPMVGDGAVVTQKRLGKEFSTPKCTLSGLLLLKGGQAYKSGSFWYFRGTFPCPDISVEFPPIPPVTSTDYSPPSGNGAAGAIVFVVVFLVIVFGSVVCARRARKAIVAELRAAVAPPPTLNVVRVWEIDAPTMERFLEELAKEKPVRFTAEQLCSFTSNYATRLGSGGFGIVYKGQFPNGVKIAVKVINRSSDRAAEQKFMAEVSTIGRIYHINLVRLYGFCYDHIMSALVHDLAISTLSLSLSLSHLHLFISLTKDKEKKETKKKAKSAFGGESRVLNPSVHFLVVEMSTPVSASNFSADFSNPPPPDIFSNAGTIAAVVIVVGADDSLDWFPKHVWNEFEKGKLGEMTLLSCGIEENNREKAERMAMVALWCVQDSPHARPLMSVVVKMLEGEVEVKPPPKPFRYLYPDNTSSSDYTSNEERFYTQLGNIRISVFFHLSTDICGSSFAEMYTLLLSPPPANNTGIATTCTIVPMVIFVVSGIILLVCAKKKRREMVSELQGPVAPPQTFVVGREIVSELREIVSELQRPMAPPPTSVVEREIYSELREIVSELKGYVAPPPTSVVGREIVLELKEIVLELREVVSELQGPVAPPPTSIVGREIDSELQGPEAPPPTSVVVQVLEIDVPTMERIAMHNPSNSSNNISHERANTHWYKETTPIMAKYEIEMASSS
ncbi:putative LRR receptor-like serine/threonine-protein kinase [Camellia lanceoleosa]|uniref:LRR receptor-like serine/threonine-protein kinase n=1 Tax=Camellia lanceoleosa TaxID=1840588 RepID=A0ACC0FIQ2_9ERIC|nr:putative LRR receptor-like serine/threonine-protein kinase [Camellia lanceoleosa]